MSSHVADFLTRHMKRSKVSGSLNGWQPVQSELTNNLLGVGEETSDDTASRDMLCNADTDVLHTPMEHPILTEHARVDLSSKSIL